MSMFNPATTRVTTMASDDDETMAPATLGISEMPLPHASLPTPQDDDDVDDEMTDVLGYAEEKIPQDDVPDEDNDYFPRHAPVDTLRLETRCETKDVFIFLAIQIVVGEQRRQRIRKVICWLFICFSNTRFT